MRYTKAHKSIVFADFTRGPITGSDGFINPEKIAGILETDFANKCLQFRIPSQSFGNNFDVNTLYISSSNNNPLVGIGTVDPKSTLDFTTVTDSSVGTELILRSARNADTGAFSGDEGGSINFTIDSGSFQNLKTSGSLAKIKTIVNLIGRGGAQGILAFELSKGAGPEGIDAFKYGYAIGGEGANFAQVQTGSLIIRDFGSAAARSKIIMRDIYGNTKFSINDGLLYASGNISCSGDIIGNINGGTF